MNEFDENEIDLEKSFETAPLDDQKAKEFWKKRELSLEEYRKQAMELWSDSCTTPRRNESESEK